MSITSYLVEVSVALSAIFLILFYVYYKYNSVKGEMDKVAESSDYSDTGSYFRDKIGGRNKAISLNAFLLDDAKSIGIRYIITSIIFFFIAGIFGFVMRVSLVEPTPTLFFHRTVLYDILTTEHGILMIYMWALGSALGFAYYLLPTFLKVKRDSMGGYSSAAFWIYLLGGIFIVLSRTSTRWYFYPPLSLNLDPYNAGGFNWLAVLGLEMIFVGVMISAIVVVKMIILDRGDDIKIEKMSLFAWSILFTLIMIVASAPFLMAGLALTFYDFFNPVFFVSSSSSPLSFAELFWIWGHPIVYIAVLPQFGLIYEIMPKFTGNKVYSYASGVLALGLLMPLSELVWGHHLLNSGFGLQWGLFFTTASFLVVIPSAITIFNYIGTLWTSTKIRMTVPMLFIVNGIFDFIVGGITGVIQSNLQLNEVLHGTYWVTGHFHFIFLGITTGIAFATIYMLFPSLTNGRKYNVRLAHWHFTLTAIGSFIMSMGWTVGGFYGMPRFVAGYFARFQAFQDTAILGGVIVGIAQLFFLANIILTYTKGPEVSTSNALEEAYTLELTESGGN
ncbi:MAG: cytochrome c oxidase subunit I [Thermoplasmataceae archaeon]